MTALFQNQTNDMIKPKHLLLCALLTSAGSAMAQKAQTTLFDNNWRFIESDVNGAQAASFDDRSWQQVNLPHDWDITHAPFAEAPMSNDGGYYPGGIGWYRKTFNRPQGKHVSLRFDGVYQRPEVYVNGEKVGQHAYGYTPFTLDITPYLKEKNNVVAVRVDNSAQPNCRWYSGSGIYRHVWLESFDDVHIAEHGVYITTPTILKDQAEVKVAVELKNEDSTERTVTLSTSFAAPFSKYFGPGSNQEVTLAAGEQRTVELTTTVTSPQLWSPSSPNRYGVLVKLSEGKNILDERQEKFGIRSFTYSAADGFRLNGEPMKINGACVHHDDGLLGAAAFDDAEIRKVKLMKEAGFNLIRTSHNPTTTAFLNACDSLGMLVIDESFDGWYTEKTKHDYHEVIDSCYKEDLRAMVLRDRNHPSIIAWSIGNEIIERRDLQCVLTAKNFKREVLKYDATRPVTEALCTWNSDWEVYDPHADVLDIVGYNYMMHKHASDHERSPQRIMWQTESYPRDAWTNWKRTSENSYIIGDIVWTGLDYLGESGIGRYYYEGETPGEHWVGKHFPWHGAYCGDVDITGWRKPISHYRDLLWNRESAPTLYMAVKEPNGYKGQIKETQWSVWPTWESWNWSGWEGKQIEVEVYTKAPAVRLYLNNKVVGEQRVSEQTELKAVFPIAYAAGTLRAVALDAAGQEGESTVLATAGQPVGLRLTADRPTMLANGQDLTYVTVEAIDAQGRWVPDAECPVSVSVTGAATLAAAGTANLKDLEPLTSPRVTLWQGRAVVVVRSNGKRGAATITVSPTDKQMRTAKTTVKVKAGSINYAADGRNVTSLNKQ